MEIEARIVERGPAAGEEGATRRAQGRPHARQRASLTAVGDDVKSSHEGDRKTVHNHLHGPGPNTWLHRVILPTWSVRLLAGLALAIGAATPVIAGVGGWLVYEDEDAAQEPEALRPRLVWLPGGTFKMGSPEGEGNEDEHPQHDVTLTPFALCETEVTMKQYELVTGERPRDCVVGCADDHPVRNVSWEDGAKFMNALTRAENRARVAKDLPALSECYEEGTWAWDEGCTGYRLPTEAEWEYGARAGTEGAYFFGEDASKLGEYAWYDENSGIKVHEVGTRRGNPWGLKDMYGNVWEWTYDGYDAGFYGSDKAEETNPANKTTASYRILRGGSFSFSAWDARSADRDWVSPEDRFWSDGLRCARGRRPQP